MKLQSTLLVVALLNAALLLPMSTTVAADMGPDPAVGTWKLNLAKSKLDPSSPAPKSSIRTYTAVPGGLQVSIESEHADGSKHTMASSFTYDGKPHPVQGSEDYDSIAVTRVGVSESKTEMMMGGKVVGHLKRVVSPDGKVMTVTDDLTTAKGVKEHDVTVYDRQ